MKRLLKKRVIIPLVIIVAVAIAASIAYAYFTSSASTAATEYTASPGIAISAAAVGTQQYLVPAVAGTDFSLVPATAADSSYVDWQDVTITNTANYAQNPWGTITTGDGTWDGVLHIAIWESLGGSSYGSQLTGPGWTLANTESMQDWAALLGVGGLAPGQSLTFRVAIWLDAGAGNNFAGATPAVNFHVAGFQLNDHGAPNS